MATVPGGPIVRLTTAGANPIVLLRSKPMFLFMGGVTNLVGSIKVSVRPDGLFNPEYLSVEGRIPKRARQYPRPGNEG